MKKILIALMGLSLIGCATFKNSKTNQYTNDEFTTENYQKHIDKIITNMDSLPDFASLDDINSNINATDLAILMQADVFFNQGDYTKALPLYEKLAYTYKNPKIIYKTIACYQSMPNPNIYVDKVNELTNLFIKSAPNTNIALILEVKESLYNNNISNAQQKLNQLLTKDKENARTYLLFLSAIISNNSASSINVDEFNQFAKFIVNKYSQYPEAELLSAIIYAITNNTTNLNETLVTIKNNYSTWQLPIIWCTDILSNNGQFNSVITVTKPYVTNTTTPDWTIENIYIGALINNNQSNLAILFLNEQKKANLNNANINLNLGIIYAKNKDYKQSFKYLSQININNTLMSNLNNVYLGLVGDITNNRKDAITYYSKVKGNVLLENIANSMLINDYSKLSKHDELNRLLTKMAKDKNLTEVDEILFKAHYYMIIEDYNHAYDILKTNYNATNSKNKDYVYLYATSLAMSHHVSDAIKIYEYYIKLEPKSFVGYNDLAYIYATQTKNYKLALKYANKAAQLNITNNGVSDTLGWTYYQMGDYVTAYPLINSGYLEFPNKEGMEHLKAVLLALHKPDLADKLKVVDKNEIETQITSLLADKILSFMMLLQYGNMGNNLLLNNGDNIDSALDLDN